MLKLFNDAQQKNPSIELAEKAILYARSQILKGSSNIENNMLDDTHKLSLSRGVMGSQINKTLIDNGRYWNGTGLRDLLTIKKQYLIDTFGVNKYLAYFEASISVTSKYSLGNCEELSLQALHYILQNSPDINAELYSIEPGDHIFLVINRDPQSNAQLPSTWGPNVVICDSWANKAYPATEIIGTLEDYYYDYKIKENKTTLFDPQRHSLLPHGCYNTTYLRNAHKEYNEKTKNLNILSSKI